ncbi:MAG: TetR/AcrR family transcriptional regulator [Chloroflexi bacterium]|nr:TetR/AcrR family transcriptional regulator [Chloroflexota bacterium]
MAETRDRITAAAVELHQEFGPLATTVAGIADRAGVGRPTVYAHFPDEPTLFAACTSHYFARHPTPHLEAWARVPDPSARLVRGLTELYRYWGEIEPMASAVLRDYRIAPDRVGGGFVELIDRCREILAAGWAVHGARERTLRAAVGLAVRFDTWRSLVIEEGLTNQVAVHVMAGMVAIVGRDPRERREAGEDRSDVRAAVSSAASP